MIRTAALLTLAAFTGPARNPDLLLAAAKGDRETAKTLLAQGAKIDAQEAIRTQDAMRFFKHQSAT